MMMKIIRALLDNVFPPRASELKVREAKSACVIDLYRPIYVADCVCLSSYQNPIVSALIAENKFYGNNQATRLLAELLIKWSQQQPTRLVLIPVPLGSKRQRDRGYNQVTEVLKRLSESSQCEIRQDLCARIKETPAQLSLSRKERLSNMTGAFKADQNLVSELRDITLVVVDDVYTTGATMAAVRAELEPNLHPSCRITCVALAH